MKYHFFLGGYDAEMVRIRDILIEEHIPFTDKQLAWGAKMSDYRDEIARAVAGGCVPVTVELQPDMPLPPSALVVDHHNEVPATPASLEQVCRLLGREMTRFDRLIAANDSDYIPGMLAAGATLEEVRYIRTMDRAAQGITQEEEDAAALAVESEEFIYGVTVVTCPHARTAAITDRLYHPSVAENVLILSGNGEVNYFGPGDICARFLERFPEAWAGGKGLGDPNGTAFCGGFIRADAARTFVLEQNRNRRKGPAPLSP